MKRSLPYVFALLCTGCTGWLLALSLPHFGGISDIPEFYSTSWMFWHGEASQVYDIQRMNVVQHTLFPTLAPERTVALFLPPPVVLFLIPLAMLPISIIQGVWISVLYTALPLAVAILGKVYGLSRGKVLGAWAVIIISGAAYDCLRIGQIGTVLLLIFAFALLKLKEKREIAGAFALSLFIVKPQLLIPHMVFLFGAARYRLLGYVCGFCALWMALSVAIVGIDGWQAYRKLMGSLTSIGEFAFDNTATICGQLMRLRRWDPQLSINISLAILALTMLLIFFTARRFKNREDWLNGFIIMVMPIACFTSLYIQDYDHVFLIPSLLLLVGWRLYAPLSPLITLPTIVLIAMILLPAYILVRYGVLLDGFPYNPFVLPIFAIAAVTSGCVIARIVGKPLTNERQTDEPPAQQEA